MASARILLAEDSAPVIAALRRALQRSGYEVELLALGAPPPESVAPGSHAAAVVRLGALGSELVRALRDLDAHLPVLRLALDEEEAAQEPSGTEDDGALVGPLTTAGILGAVRIADRLGRARRRAAELEAVAARRVDSAQELAFLKRVLLLEVKRSRRYGYPVSLVLLAVDRWSEATRGMAAAAAAALLGELLALLTTAVRDIDQAVPFGDDRLLVLLPHTRPEGALRVARRLVSRIRDREGVAKVTASAGVAGHEGEGTVSFGGLVKAAAEALGRARTAGGDRAEAAERPSKRDRISLG